MYSEYCYIVFTKAKPAWWTRFAHKDYQHCYTIEPMNGKWLVIDKNSQNVDVFVLDDISDILSKNTVVKVQRQIKRQWLLLDTCVSYVKQYIGAAHPFIITPYQLLKYMRRFNEKSKGTREDSRATSNRDATNKLAG